MNPILPTTEEAKRIRRGDKELKDKYYLANYEFIGFVARGYCRNREIDIHFSEDMTQECYLYFEKFKFDRVFTFVRSIKDVCVFAYFCGERVYHQARQGNCEILTTLDNPVKDQNGEEFSTLGDLIPSDFDVIEEIEPSISYTDSIYNLLKHDLPPRQAEAFGYFYYSDIKAEDVAKSMGIKITGAQSLKTNYMNYFRRNKEHIQAELSAIGYKVQI